MESLVHEPIIVREMKPLSADWDPARRTMFGPQELALEQLLNKWDPIGVFGLNITMEDGSFMSWPMDEYDDLVRPLLSLLRQRVSRQEFELQVDELVARDYGIAAPLSGVTFVDQVFAWWAIVENPTITPAVG